MMARQFNVDAAKSTFNLSEQTRQEIQGLILDLDMNAIDVVERAIHRLWQEEMGEPERDVYAELDELRQRIEGLENK